MSLTIAHLWPKGRGGQPACPGRTECGPLHHTYNCFQILCLTFKSEFALYSRTSTFDTIFRIYLVLGEVIPSSLTSAHSLGRKLSFPHIDKPGTASWVILFTQGITKCFMKSWYILQCAGKSLANCILMVWRLTFFKIKLFHLLTEIKETPNLDDCSFFSIENHNLIFF